MKQSLSLADMCDEFVIKAANQEQTVAHWVKIFEDNIKKMRDAATNSNLDGLKQITNSFSNDLRAMEDWLKLQSGEEFSDEFTKERNRLRQLRILKDKKKIGLT